VKKVLFITYPFPPLGAAGAIRPFRFVKYLPEYSWEPIVLTVKEGKGAPRDEGLLEEIPSHIKIARTRTFDPYLAWQHRRKEDSEKNLKKTASLPAHASQRSSFWKMPLLKMKSFASALVNTPDHQVFWFPFALLAALRIIRKEGAQAVITTSPPHSEHFVGLAIRKLVKIPWVADFRDPWYENIQFWKGKTKLQKGLEHSMEKMIVKNADKVIANTETNRISLLKRYPGQDPEKFICIPNGFEKLDGDKRICFRKFTITHTGILYPDLEPYFFLTGIREWILSHPEGFRDTVQVLLLGENNEKTARVIRKLDLDDLVEIRPRVPHREALQIARSSDLLLVCLGFEPHNPGWVPMKFYDYLGCGRPVLGFLPEGEAARIIRETGAGYAICEPDVEATTRVLDLHYEMKTKGEVKSGLKRNEQAINRFNVRGLTEQLARELSSLTETDLGERGGD